MEFDSQNPVTQREGTVGGITIVDNFEVSKTLLAEPICKHRTATSAVYTSFWPTSIVAVGSRMTISLGILSLKDTSEKDFRQRQILSSSYLMAGCSPRLAESPKEIGGNRAKDPVQARRASFIGF